MVDVIPDSFIPATDTRTPLLGHPRFSAATLGPGALDVLGEVIERASAFLAVDTHLLGGLKDRGESEHQRFPRIGAGGGKI